MKLKYLVLSDIHFGNPNNPTPNIIKNLDNFFITYAKTISSSDFIFLAGDVFDRKLQASDNNYTLAIKWLVWLATYCSKRKIKLRILEGTLSHDHHQCHILNYIFYQHHLDLDFRYIQDIQVEITPKGSILYIPDNMAYYGEDVFDQAETAVFDTGLQQVDIGIFHGLFHYQLPHLNIDLMLSESKFQDLVKHYITIGHIHTFSTNGRIIAPGSFDRLTFGQEEPKGGIFIEYHPLLEDKFTFLENTNAMLFNTIEILENEDYDIFLSKLDKLIKQMKKGNIRIKIPKNYKHLVNLPILANKYPTIKFKLKEESPLQEIEIVDKTIKEINIESISPSNIEKLLFERLTKYNFNNKELNLAKEFIRSNL